MNIRKLILYVGQEFVFVIVSFFLSCLMLYTHIYSLFIFFIIACILFIYELIHKVRFVKANFDEEGGFRL